MKRRNFLLEATMFLKKLLSLFGVKETPPHSYVIHNGTEYLVENGKCREMITIDLNNLPPGIKCKNGKLYGKPVCC